MNNKKIVTLLNIASITNFIIFAIIGLRFIDSGLSLFTLYATVFLLFSGIFYQSLMKKSIQEIKEQKTVLLLIALLSLPLNFIQSILIFIVVDETQKIKELKLRGSPKKEKIDPQIQKLDNILKLGVGLVILSGIVFTTQTYELIPDIIKVFLILLLGIVFLGLSDFSEKTLKIEKTTKMYYLLGMSFIILSYISFGYYNPFNLDINLIYSLVFLIIALVSYIANKKYPNDILTNIIKIASALSIYYFIISFKTNTLLLIIANLVIIALSLKNKNLKLLAYIYITMTQVVDLEPLYIAINGMISLIGILLLNNKEENKILSVYAGILIPSIILLVFLSINNNQAQLATSVLALIYASLALVKYNEKNNVFQITLQSSVNLAFFVLLIIAIIDGEAAQLYVASLSLFSHYIYINMNKTNNTIEKYLQIFKIIILIISIFTMFNTINDGLVMTTIYLLCGLLYVLTKDKEIKNMYLVGFILFLTESIFEFSNPFLGMMALIFAILFHIYFKDKKTFIYMILAIYVAIIETNILDTTLLYSNLVCLIFYLSIILITRKNELYQKITYLSISLPLFSIMSNVVENTEIKRILFMGLGFYLIYSINKYFIKENNDTFKAVSISAVLLLNVFTESILTGLIIGTISLILIIISLSNEKEKQLLNVGIIFTILNVLYQLRTVIDKIPFPIYMLIVGLVLIGIVTYKMKKEIEKK